MSGEQTIKVFRPRQVAAFQPRRCRDEHTEQAYLMKWVELNRKRLPGVDRIFAIPNGGKRGKAAAGKLKAEGVRPGVLDLFLPLARGGYFGLFIEMKALDGRLSPEQAIEIGLLTDDRYLALTAYGMQAGIDILEWYMRCEPTPVAKLVRACPFPYTGVKPAKARAT